MKSKLDIISFLKSIPISDYKIDRLPSAWTLKFHTFTKFQETIFKKECDELVELGLIILNIRNTLDEQFKKFTDLKDEILNLDISIKKDNLKNFLIETQSIDSVNFDIDILFNQYELNDIQVNEKYSASSKVYICLFIPDLMHSNEYICFTSTIPRQLKLKQVDFNKALFIKQNSTVLVKSFSLPELFYFPSTTPRFILNKLNIYFVFNCLLSFSSFSVEKENDIQIGFRGYRSHTVLFSFEHLLSLVVSLDINQLYQIYSWVFEDIRISDTKLSIVRNLLSLDNCNTIELILAKLNDDGTFLKSCKHQYELIINGSIKEHFENLNAIQEKAKQYIVAINEQIFKLMNSITNVAIGVFGLALSISGKIYDLSDLAMTGLLIIVAAYVLYQKFVYIPQIEGYQEDIILQSIAYKETLSKNLKILSADLQKELFDEPISKIKLRFDKNHLVVENILSVIFGCLIIFIIIYLF